MMHLPAALSTLASKNTWRPRQVGRSDHLFPVLALSIVWVGMLVMIHPTGDFPINDDWMFGSSVRSILNGGRYEIISFSAPNVGPLVYWGALFCLPFGFSFEALRLSTQVLGLVGAVGLYFLARNLWSERNLALVAALTLVVNPIYLALSNTFMTDVPFVVMSLLSVLLLESGFRTNRPAMLVSGLSLALVALLIRQFAIMIFVGFLFATVLREKWSVRRLGLAFTPLAIALATHVLFNLWLLKSGRKPHDSGIPDISLAAIFELSKSSIFDSFVIVQYVGLFIVPIGLFCLSRISWRPTKSLMISLVVLFVFGFAYVYIYYVKHQAMPLAMNAVNYFGIGPFSLGDTFKGGRAFEATPIMSTFWKLLTLVALMGSLMLTVALFIAFARICTRIHERKPGARMIGYGVFFGSAISTYLLLVLMVTTRHPLFDRYLLLLFIFGALAVPALLLLPLRGASASRFFMVASGVVLLGSATFSVLALHDFFSWNRARWEAISELVASRGVSPQEIDAGFEFGGWYLYDPLYVARENKSPWWVRDDRFILASGPVRGYSIIGRKSVFRSFSQTEVSIFTLERDTGLLP